MRDKAKKLLEQCKHDGNEDYAMMLANMISNYELISKLELDNDNLKIRKTIENDLLQCIERIEKTCYALSA